MGKITLKKLAAVLLVSGVLIAFISCKEIGLRGYIIDKVVGLEEVELDSPTINNATPVVSWEEIQGAAGYRYQWDAIEADGWTETSDTSFVQEQELPDGEHILYLQVKNAAGLWSPIYSFLFNIDHTLTAPPAVTGPATTTSLRPTWTWSAVDGAVQYSYQLDATGEDGYTATAALSYTPEAGLSIGEHRLYVRGQNADGKWSGWGYHAVMITEPDDGGGDTDPIDTTPPTVESHTPGSADSVASVNIVITFSEAMDTASTEGAFSLKEGAAPGTTDVSGSFSWSAGDTVMTFNPDTDFTVGETVTYSLSTVATDAAGNALTAGIGNTSFDVIGLFSAGPFEINTTSGKIENSRAINWNGSQYACLYTSTSAQVLKVFSDPSDIAATTAQTVLADNLYIGFSDLAWNGTNYGMVFSGGTTTGNVYFYSAGSDGIVGAGKTIRAAESGYARPYVPNLSWDTVASEWGIVWYQDSDGGAGQTYDIFFARADADGDLIAGPFNLTNTSDVSQNPQILWLGTHFGILYTNDTGDYEGYFLTVPSQYNGSGGLIPKQVTAMNTYSGMRGAWNGTELGVLWTDRDSSNDFYFITLDADGDNLTTAIQIADSDYTGGYSLTVEDFKDIAWNGTSFGILWSQENNTTYGTEEVQFCTLSKVGATWSQDSVPVIISPDDSSVYNNPRLTSNESRWCVTYDKVLGTPDYDDLFFIY